MSLITSIQKYVPLGRKPTLPRGETLALKPIRNPVVTWERPEGDETAEMLLRVPRRQDRLVNLLVRWLPTPTHKTIELDEFGAAIWERCDGVYTMQDLVSYVSQTHKLNRRQAEVSVLAFLKMLAQRHLVGFMDAPKDTKKTEEPHGKPRPQRQRRFVRTTRRRH
jgi:hypothetical protein